MDNDAGLPFTLDDHINPLDWSGRAIHPAKQGKIPDNVPPTPILKRLQIDPGVLLRDRARQENGFYQVVGKQSAIRRIIARLDRHFRNGISGANRLFPEPA